MGYSWQVRAELEWPDAATVVPPPGWRWSDTCFWVVNSDGVANDPQRRLVKRGGQLHTPVTRSPDDLAAQCAPLFVRLSPVPNYRSSMRVGVRVPDLQDDLDGLKRLAEFTRTHLPRLWLRVDPLEALLDVGDTAGPAVHKGAHARLSATIRARHHLMPEDRHRARMAATRIAAFVAPDKTLNTVTGMLREAVDVRVAPGNGWVVFRCFAQAASASQVHAAAGFAVDWVRAALHGGDPNRVITKWEPGLPRQLAYAHTLERGWAETNFHHHSRRTVAARLAQRGVTG